MRRRSLGFAVFSLLAMSLGLIIVHAPVPLAAQSGTPTAGQGFVGSWYVNVNNTGGPPAPSLGTFAADGTLLVSDPPVSPASGGQPATVVSASHGVWEATGENTAAITFVELVTDIQGHPFGLVTISARLTLSADGNSFSGPFSVTVADPSGKVLFVGTGTVQGTRITVQPMATPAASPAASPAA